MIWNDAGTSHLWKATGAGAEWYRPKDCVLAAPAQLKVAMQSVLVGKYHRYPLPLIQMDTGQHWCSWRLGANHILNVDASPDSPRESVQRYNTMH